MRISAPTFLRRTLWLSLRIVHFRLLTNALTHANTFSYTYVVSDTIGCVVWDVNQTNCVASGGGASFTQWSAVTRINAAHRVCAARTQRGTMHHKVWLP